MELLLSQNIEGKLEVRGLAFINNFYDQNLLRMEVKDAKREIRRAIEVGRSDGKAIKYRRVLKIERPRS